MSEGKDRIYASEHQPLGDFRFDDNVAAVFPDMIRRSVPGYASIVGMLGLFAERHAQPGSNLYDLGCSLGAATLAMRRRISAPGCRLLAVDNSPAMVERCRENVAADNAATPVEVQCADLREVAFERASVVVFNFTLQFVPPEDRAPLLKRIREAMLPGGVLLLAEKIAFADPQEQQFQETMHLAFKRANGYSELEISQKRAALEKVLIPDTIETHRQRLHDAGFSQVYLWSQNFNFAALAAIAD